VWIAFFEAVEDFEPDVKKEEKNRKIDLRVDSFA
jgi:hypothetical protein